MTRRWLALPLLIACVVPSSALAQGAPGGNPFGPLPQPQAPAPAPPEPQPVDTSSSDDDALGGTAFWLIIGATGALFAAIAFFIVRDMRKTVGTRRQAPADAGHRPARGGRRAGAGRGGPAPPGEPEGAREGPAAGEDEGRAQAAPQDALPLKAPQTKTAACQEAAVSVWSCVAG